MERDGAAIVVKRYIPSSCPNPSWDIYAPRICAERKTRILICVAAYAYEILSNPIMSDAEFDRFCLTVDVSLDTGNPIIDQFFRDEFDPYTGSWIYVHPELDKIALLYKRYYKYRTKGF